jgi:hypothetical protein
LAVPKALEVPVTEEIERIIREVLPRAPGMPEFPFEYGRVYLEERKWYHVSFKREFAEAPAVLVSAEVRSGWFKPKRYVVPVVKISIPKVEVPAVSIPTVTVPTVAVPAAPTIRIPTVEIPRAPTIRIPGVEIPRAPTISIPTIRVPSVEISRIRRGDLRPVVRDQFRAALGDWGWLNWARNAIADGPGWVVGSFLNWLWDVMIQPQIDKVRDSINDGLRKMTGNTQGALNAYRDRIQSAVNAGLADARAKVQAALNAYRGYIQRSINSGLGDARAKTQSALNSYRGYIQDSVNKGLLDARQKVQVAFVDFRERLQANFNEALGSANRSLASFRDSTNNSLETLRSATESNINRSTDRLRASVEDAFNTLIPTLWAMEGMPEGVLMTPTVYRNITPTGFDILSLGKMTVSYLAVGLKA